MSIPTASLFSPSAVSAASSAEVAKPSSGAEAGKSFSSTLQAVSRRPQARQDVPGAQDRQAVDASEHSPMDRPSVERTTASQSDDSGSSAQTSAQRPTSEAQAEPQETESVATDSSPVEAGNDPVNQSLLLAMLATPVAVMAPQPAVPLPEMGQAAEDTATSAQVASVLAGLVSTEADTAETTRVLVPQATNVDPAVTPVMTESTAQETVASTLPGDESFTTASMSPATEPDYTVPKQDDAVQTTVSQELKPEGEKPVDLAPASAPKETVNLHAATHEQNDVQIAAKSDHPRGLERAEQMVGRPVGAPQKDVNGVNKEAIAEEDRPGPVHAAQPSVFSGMEGQAPSNESETGQEFAGHREREQAQESVFPIAGQAPSHPASVPVSYAGVSSGVVDARTAASTVPSPSVMPLTTPPPQTVSDHMPATVPGQSRSVVLEVAQPELGHLNIRVALNQERVHTFMTSDRAEVGQFLANGQDRLQAAFQQAGLDMGQFRVDIHQQSAGRSFHQQMSQGQSHGQSFYGNQQGQRHGDGQEPGTDQHRRQGLLSLVA